MSQVKIAASKSEWWRKRIANQQRSGLSVRRFCEEEGLTENAFYKWRKQLRRPEPVRFALVERGPSLERPETPLELLLPTGECLRIGMGVDAATLRAVLEALRT